MLNIFSNWKLNLVFLIIKLKLSLLLDKNLFKQSYFIYLLLILIKRNIKSVYTFKIEHFFNKQIIKEVNSHFLKYLIC